MNKLYYFNVIGIVVN